MLNPCARESKARTGRFLREKLISDHGLFSSYEGQQGAAIGQDSCDVISGMHRASDGRVLARTGFPNSRPLPPWTSLFQFSIFLHDMWP